MHQPLVIIRCLKSILRLLEPGRIQSVTYLDKELNSADPLCRESTGGKRFLLKCKMIFELTTALKRFMNFPD